MAGSRTGGAVPFYPQFRVVARGINRSFETYIYIRHQGLRADVQYQTKDVEWRTSRGFPNPLSLTAIRITKTNGRGKIIRVEILVTYVRNA
jgi:hypothetical protein